jgi:PHD/YefM family antitoxin component YafN of YafNO toxin-antitoxin module
MIKVASLEFERSIERDQDMALAQPVAVTRNGGERTMMIQAAKYYRLNRRDRQVLELEDFANADLDELERTTAPEASKGFDHELK